MWEWKIRSYYNTALKTTSTTQGLCLFYCQQVRNYSLCEGESITNHKLLGLQEEASLFIKY